MTTDDDTVQQPASAWLLELLSAKWLSQAVGVVARLGIADLVAGKPRTSLDLATACEADPRALYRILRATACVGVFAEDDRGRFALTPLAEPLRSDVPGSLRAAAITMNMDPMWRPYGHIEHSVRTGEPAFDYVYGMNVHQYLRDHPEAAELFRQTAAGFHAMSTPPIVAAYDFSPYRTVVDVGGGIGVLLAAILHGNPQARGVLLEDAGVIPLARDRLAAEGVADRVDLVAGDFFAEVPSTGDLYLIKSCLHNWDDHDAGRILATIRAAMPAGVRLLVVDAVVPAGNGFHYSKVSDVELLTLAGGRERRADEWQALFAATGFRLSATVPTPGPVALMEVEAA
ncbi:methyltransferase [Streptosporangium fragile]|uniref:Methyltransferase n=1 Tax=Streptosporangium fragile TaxID=46186 RepID=A0ABP6I960_9ACTN